MSVNDRGSPLASTSDVMLVQEAMRHLGLYDGPIDGIAGARTLIAVRACKRRAGLPSDKSLDADFIRYVREST